MAAEEADLAWHGGRHVTVRVRGHQLDADKPKEKGYTDEGPMATELYLAALGTCTMHSTIRVAEVRKVPLEALEAHAELDFDERDRVSIIRLEFRVTSTGTRQDWEVIARMAGKFCTIEQLTKPPIEKRFVLNGKETITSPKAE